ncbi:malectin domain-containing carbohydrate-binding protein [Marinagarivorans cellulosilyticus]|uniref:Uncharacterized protein n=1 Tax=Marinagarivorans cellulosilyticus TaxID=2721545 RepID=A0AAN2BKT8_9GAMM|nr:malectin domain-containing carbohydrate-binding protein [Marinagarivorans cellulosilyticus]BCD98356.1 hypothetical protein MARGE09_P2557 [Marinagarivorans cellulosilyticus]
MNLRCIFIPLIALGFAGCVAQDSTVSSSSEAAPASSVTTTSSSPTSSSQASSSSLTPPVSSSSAAAISSSSMASGEKTMVMAINVGAREAATYNGIEYGRDQFGSGGTQNSTPDPIANTDEDSLFQSERYGEAMSYSIPVTNATYTVVLHFVEMYQTANAMRTFDVSIEDQTVLSALDIHDAAGHDTAYSYTAENLAVSDGKLSITLTARNDNATLSGFAIYSSDGGQFVEPVIDSSAVCPASEPCRILPFGDSITDGVPATGAGGYRAPLFELAVNAGKSITFVGGNQNGPATIAGQPFPQNHQGHSGWTVAQINDLIPSPAFDGSPHIVLLHIGTNDMWNGPNGLEGRLESLDDILNEAPNALVAVASIIPWQDHAARIASYNQAIPGIVQAQVDAGFKVIFVDQFQGFPSQELADGIHPNAAGYERMGQKWFDAIESYLP